MKRFVQETYRILVLGLETDTVGLDVAGGINKVTTVAGRGAASAVKKLLLRDVKRGGKLVGDGVGTLDHGGGTKAPARAALALGTDAPLAAEVLRPVDGLGEVLKVELGLGEVAGVAGDLGLSIGVKEGALDIGLETEHLLELGRGEVGELVDGHGESLLLAVVEGDLLEVGLEAIDSAKGSLVEERENRKE